MHVGWRSWIAILLLGFREERQLGVALQKTCSQLTPGHVLCACSLAKLLISLRVVLGDDMLALQYLLSFLTALPLLFNSVYILHHIACLLCAVIAHWYETLSNVLQ